MPQKMKKYQKTLCYQIFRYLIIHFVKDQVFEMFKKQKLLEAIFTETNVLSKWIWTFLSTSLTILNLLLKETHSWKSDQEKKK